MRRLKKLLIGVVLAVVLVLAAAVIFLSTADFNEYKDTIAAELKAATGRDVTIGGKIETRFLTATPVIVVNDLAVANPPWASRKDMVRIRRLEVRVALMSVIFGRVNINRVTAIEPDILLETDASGRQNWIFAATKAKAAQPAGATNLAIKELRIVRAKIAYLDGATRDVDRFGIQSLTARSTSVAGPMSFDALGSFEDKAARFKGRIGPPADLFAGRAVEIMLNGSLGRSDLAGTLVVQSRDKLAIKGTLRSDRLDSRDFGASGGGGAASRIFGNDPIPVGLLRILTADVSYRAKSGTIGGTPMTDAKAAIRIVNGVLTISDIEANIASGHLVGSVSLNAAARPSKFTAKTTLSQLSLKQLTPEVSGPMSVNVDVQGVGDTPRAIAETLNGRTSLIGGPGRVANDALVLLTFGIGSIQKLLTRGSVRAENVNCVVARFDFAGGIGRSRVLVTDSARLTFIGQGIVSLKTERMNLLFVPRTKETGLGDVTVHPVRVTGHLLRPTASIDASAAAKEAAKNVVSAAQRGLNFVGSLVGATNRQSGGGSPCAHAIAIAGGKQQPPRAGSSRLSGSSKGPSRRPRRKKGLLQRLNPFD
jgi:AsmA family protein